MKVLLNRVAFIAKEQSVKNFIQLSLNQGVNVLVALIITPYLFQTLGEEGYGLVSLALTIIMLLGMIVNYGFNLSVPQELALVKNNVRAKQIIINEAIFTRLLLTICITILLVFSTYYLGLFSGYSIILIFSLTQLFNDAVYPMYILQGFERISWVARANAVSKLFYLGAVLLFIKTVDDSKWVNFFLGATGLLTHSFLLVMVYRAESIKFQWVSFKRIRFWLFSNFQFFSSTIASYILLNGGTIILKSFVSNAELGFYALAQRLALLLRTVPVFISQAITQNASRLYAQDKEQFELYLKRNQRNGLIITSIVCLVFAISSKWVVRVLAGEFIPIASHLVSILCFLPLIGMFNVSNMIRILVAKKKYILSKAIWITTVFMLIICPLGAYYFGSYGLSVGLVFSEVFNFFIHRLLIKQAKA